MPVPTIRVEYADCSEAIPRLVADGIVVDAVVTDPPYHLTAMTKRFGAGQAAAKSLDHQRFASGFMGQRWDGGDIAFRSETWVTIATVLRPGGFLVAFGGTRTFHRLACAIEDAGFVIQDTMMWLYGSGFPKRPDALKPAFEPIVVAYKPGGKRTLQVDECRIPAGADDLNGGAYRGNGTHRDDGWGMQRLGGAGEYKHPSGRWPANVCHDGSVEVMEAFAAFGDRNSGQPRDDRGYGGFWGVSSGKPCGPQYGDSGSSARFFFQAKADVSDRLGSRHPTVKPLALMRWLVSLVVSPGGLVLDPFAGTGSTGIAARATGRNSILIESNEQYVKDIRERVAFYGLRGSRRRSGPSAQRLSWNKDKKPDGRLF